MIFLLIRHGDNESLGKYLPGQQAGIHLNKHGQEQAEAIANSLEMVNIDAIYSSPLERAVETASPLAARKNLPIKIHAGLIEMDAGKLTGKDFKQLKKLKSWQKIRSAPALSGFPDGETFVDAQIRLWQTLDEIRAGHAENAIIALFSHSDPVKMLIARALSFSLEAFPTMIVDPASLSILEFRKETTWLAGLNLHLPYHLPPLTMQ